MSLKNSCLYTVATIGHISIKYLFVAMKKKSLGLISTVVWITFTWCCNKLCIYAVCKTALPKMSAIYSNSRQEQYITQIIKQDMCTCLCSLCQGSHGCPHKTTTLWNKFFIRIFKSELRIESSFFLKKSAFRRTLLAFKRR